MTMIEFVSNEKDLSFTGVQVCRQPIDLAENEVILALLVARAVLHTATLAPTKGQVWDLLAGCRISEGHGYPVLTRKLRHSTRFVMEARFAHGCPAIHKHCAVVACGSISLSRCF
jgi:hypothetical protein